MGLQESHRGVLILTLSDFFSLVFFFSFIHLADAGTMKVFSLATWFVFGLCSRQLLGLPNESAAVAAIVLQNRGAKKQGSEKRKFYEAAQEHLTAALKEDRKNFLANFAFAEMNRDVAEQSTTVVVPASRFSLFSAQEIEAKDVDTWKAVNRYAQKAVLAKPNDIQSLNLLAKAKFELGDIPEAKRLTVRAINTSKSARFADERKAAAETKALMEKINDHFEKEKK